MLFRSNEAINLMHYFTFPASLMDSASKNDFGTPTAIPITYVIGKDGVIVDALRPDVKMLTEAGLGDMVKNLLDAKYEAPKVDAPKDDAAKADVSKTESKP